MNWVVRTNGPKKLRGTNLGRAVRHVVVERRLHRVVEREDVANRQGHALLPLVLGPIRGRGQDRLRAVFCVVSGSAKRRVGEGKAGNLPRKAERWLPPKAFHSRTRETHITISFPSFSESLGGGKGLCDDIGCVVVFMYSPSFLLSFLSIRCFWGDWEGRREIMTMKKRELAGIEVLIATVRDVGRWKGVEKTARRSREIQ
jgi:hypothetical protein